MEYNNDFVFDESNYFHGIRFNLIAYLSILKHGILSNKQQMLKGISSTCNYEYGRNGNDNISVAKSIINYPMEEWKNTAYNAFVKDGISFAIKKGELSFNYILPCGYNDEFFIKDEISPNSIVAIGIPSKYANTDIEDLPFGLFCMDGNFLTIKSKCYDAINIISKNNYRNFQELKLLQDLLRGLDVGLTEPLEQIKTAIELDKRMSSYIGGFFKEKYGVSHMTLGEFININNPKNLPIYNSTPKDITKACTKSPFFKTGDDLISNYDYVQG